MGLATVHVYAACIHIARHGKMAACSIHMCVVVDVSTAAALKTVAMM